MTTTFTITPAQLDRLRPGDIITHLDGLELGPVHITSHPARFGPDGPMCLPGRYTGTPTGSVTLFPESLSAQQIHVTRPGSPPTRKSVKSTRTIDGLTLLRTGDRVWITEDRQYELVDGNAGYTTCQEDHRVQITDDLSAAARQAQGTWWAQPILAAAAAGLRSYLCPAGSEHPYNGWRVWSTGSLAVIEEIAPEATLTAAARSLSAYLNR